MKKAERLTLLNSCRRLVIKIGTQVATTADNRVDTSTLESIVQQVAELKRLAQRQVILVTSGAVAAGMQVLGWKKRPTSLNYLQAAASVGQSRLMRVYERSFRDLGLNVGQVLLTRDIFRVATRRANARQTLKTLLEFGVVPIINENDSVAVEELKFGDNDTLAALVTELLSADLLLILTGVRGLYDHDPRSGRAHFISEVTEFNEKILALTGANSASRKGLGGIASKLQAAQHVTRRGAVCIIAHGKRPSVIRSVMAGKPVGTFFFPAPDSGSS